MKAVSWLVTLGCVAGMVASFMDSDPAGVALLGLGMLLVLPLAARRYAGVVLLRRSDVRVLLALCLYGVLFLPMLNGRAAEEGVTIQSAPAGTPHPFMSGYFHSPWPGEDGGPERLQVPGNLPGLDIREGSRVKVTRRFSRLANMVILRRPGEVYLLTTALARNRYLGLPSYSRLERVDPVTLETITRSPRLKAGPGWPGGVAAHANGDLYVVFGRWCHRLDADCHLLASYRLPYNHPYNSFVILDNGTLVMKEMSEKASHLTVLDPITMKPVCDHIPLYEPSVARISARGNTVYVVGTRSIFRYPWSSRAYKPVFDEKWVFDYVKETGRSFGWDPVISEKNAWFLDNGDHGYRISMLGAAETPGMTHVVRVSLADASDATVFPVSGLPLGTVTNPPVYCEDKKILVAYDSANAVIKAWRHGPEANAFTLLWEKEGFGASNHMIYFPDTGELCTNDYAYGRGDASVVLDVESGEEKARVNMNTLFQGVIFSAPGWRRDYYYVTFDTVARVYLPPSGETL
ncbi:hypothetical protein [Desulfoluna spongiiphila]|uniref:LVIVD repeat-containing protein n=1 Tax=Desulfoluna spongiiphila TaxID=419481 RepID=A0A1G5EQQ3_9BACT|nr:hypothetical protein [Desulfoluna spongiiphila]SCY29345.1 hypothetical protein SAMN05216233_106168 [Desulfoluna spongiiphila]